MNALLALAWHVVSMIINVSYINLLPPEDSNIREESRKLVQDPVLPPTFLGTLDKSPNWASVSSFFCSSIHLSHKYLLSPLQLVSHMGEAAGESNGRCLFQSFLNFV